MSTNLERFKSDLVKLGKLGVNMHNDIFFQYHSKQGKELEKEQELLAETVRGYFRVHYQNWYSEAHAVIKQLLPDRLLEFTQLYQGGGNRVALIQNWLVDLNNSVDDFRGDRVGKVLMCFDTQRSILASAMARFESSLFQITQLVRADLFDSELDAARELVGNGFLRGAGAVAGVVIERHLGQVSINHNVPCKKPYPTINDLNELLKSAKVVDVPTWRQIQRLGDIRNLCDHNAQREPPKDEVVELIDGTGKLCKTIF
jgi:hypothetical protein